MAESNPGFARFARNPEGEDYFVGDIHGCFGQLEERLARVGFDPARDRAFAVGDLVDRGPDSKSAIEWLEKPWFHSCLGNHDDMVLSDSQHQETLLWWARVNGGDWWLSLNDERKRRFTECFSRLPLALEVETAWGRVGVVHADVPAHLSWPQFLEALERGDPEARETALWGRLRADGFVTTPVSGIDRVVCGHTMVPGRHPYSIANVWFIDTGAFLEAGGALMVLSTPELFEGAPEAWPPLA